MKQVFIKSASINLDKKRLIQGNIKQTHWLITVQLISVTIKILYYRREGCIFQ